MTLYEHIDTACMTLLQFKSDIYIYTYTYRFQLCVATMNAALRLFLCVIGRLTRTADYVIDVLKASIALLLFALEKVNPFVTQNRLEKRKITDIFKNCEQALREWVAKPEVIGASFFGGSLSRQKLLKGLQELEVYM